MKMWKKRHFYRKQTGLTQQQKPEVLIGEGWHGHLIQQLTSAQLTLMWVLADSSLNSLRNCVN